MGLLDDLHDEERNRRRDYGCTACDAIASAGDEETREALAAALAGTLSVRAILRISQKHDLNIGRAGILKHRREEHGS